MDARQPWDPERDGNDAILPGDSDLPGGSGLPEETRRPVRTRQRHLAVIALVVAVALLLAATSLFWLIVSPGGRAATADAARIGDCLVFDASGPTYRPADCADASAEFRLLAVSVDRDGCVDVPGAVRAYGEGNRFSCIGDKSADPATALNGLATGDCVAIEANRPVRAGCEGGTLAVLAVVKGVPKSAGESRDGLFGVCTQAGASDVRQTYAWGLGGADGSEPTTWDRLLCLGMS
jgi:hypothetical protein